MADLRAKKREPPTRQRIGRTAGAARRTKPAKKESGNYPDAGQVARAERPKSRSCVSWTWRATSAAKVHDVDRPARRTRSSHRVAPGRRHGRPDRDLGQVVAGRLAVEGAVRLAWAAQARRRSHPSRRAGLSSVAPRS